MGLYLEGDLEGARLHYLAALRVDPEFLATWANLAVVLGQMNQLQAAVVCLRKLLAYAPHDSGQLNNLGNMLTRLERYPEARETLMRCVELAPDNPTTWYNLALLSIREHKYREALEHFDRMEALGHTSHTVRNDRAHALLGLGENLPETLALYEALWFSMIHLPPWDFHVPEWQGESLEGKRILFHGEQGYGDTIMTSRFHANLAARGAQVTLGLPADLCDLYAHQGLSVANIFALTPAIMAEFDYHTPMYSAMRWLGVTREQIDPTPYLRAPQTHSSLSRNFNVGICWGSGLRGGEMDWRRRHAPLSLWLSLAELPGVQLYSLQKGPDENEIQALGADAVVIDETRSWRSWYDTAAFVAKLDLVVSVDTAVVHLAGALGKPCIMLAQYNHCWRWWNIDRESALPWYSSVSIIRQGAPGDWSGQLAHVRERLRLRDRALRRAA